jgi:hypothetical protein
MFPPGFFDVVVIIGMYLIVVFSSFSVGDNDSFLSRNWQDFIPSLTLVGANILLFYHYGDLFVQGQVSYTIVLLTNGILTQLAVWVYQLWISPRLGDPEYLRAGLGVSTFLDGWGLLTTCVQIRNFGWTEGNIASFVVGLLSVLLAATFVLREKIRGRALWRR